MGRDSRTKFDDVDHRLVSEQRPAVNALPHDEGLDVVEVRELDAGHALIVAAFDQLRNPRAA
jgi:hypothetical protein